MLNRKILNLLLVAVVAIPITAIAYLLTIDSNRVAAQVQEVARAYPPATGLVDEQQKVGANLSYQGIYTNPNTLNLPGDTDLEEGHVEVANLSDAEIAPQSTNSGSEFVPASAFRSDGFPGAAVGYRFSVIGVPFPGGYVRSISADVVCMAAPVYLPNGTTVTEFSIYFMDDHPTLEMDNFIRLWRKSHASPGSAANTMASFVSPSGIDETTIFQGFDDTISNATVSNNFGYYITFCLYGNTDVQHLVYGFRVDYNP